MEEEDKRSSFGLWDDISGRQILSTRPLSVGCMPPSFEAFGALLNGGTKWGGGCLVDKQMTLRQGILQVHKNQGFSLQKGALRTALQALVPLPGDTYGLFFLLLVTWWGKSKQTRPNPISGRGGNRKPKRPNRLSSVSK